MIKVSFNHHDFLFAIEGFVRGSHLRQHVWRNIVYKAIPQMSADDMDFLWFFLRRDTFGVYFCQNSPTSATMISCTCSLLCIGAIAIKCCSGPRMVPKRSGRSAIASTASIDRCIFIISMKVCGGGNFNMQ